MIRFQLQSTKLSCGPRSALSSTVRLRCSKLSNVSSLMMRISRTDTFALELSDLSVSLQRLTIMVLCEKYDSFVLVHLKKGRKLLIGMFSSALH